MKKILLFILIIICNYSFSQDQNNDIITISPLKNGIEILEKLSPFSTKDIINTEHILFPLEYIETYNILGNTKFFKVYHNKKIGYVPISGFDISEIKLQQIKNLSMDFDPTVFDKIEDAHFEKLQKEKRLAEEKINEEINKIKEAILKEYDKKGLVITKKEYTYKEHSSQFGLKIDFYNGYNKKIKYIDLTIRPYNRVGDITTDDIGKNVNRLQLIGPIEEKSFSHINVDDLFWDDNNIIKLLVITYIKITFTDNSVKEIKNIQDHLAKDVYNEKGS